MKSKLKVSIIGTNGLPAKYGGFETLTDQLVRNLNEEFDITVYCSKTPKQLKIPLYQGSRLIYSPFKANGWQSFIYDFTTIIHSYFYADVIVVLGFSGAFAFPFNVFFRKKIVFNIGGIEWKKIRGHAKTARIEIALKKWMEFICIKYSHSIIVDNETFIEIVKSRYKKTPVLVEYGGDHAISKQITSEAFIKYPFLKNPYDLTVSRAQPDMNIHIVIEAYSKTPLRTLVIISNWEISEYGINLKNKYLNKYQNIILLPAIYVPEDLNIIRSNCNLYIHTHSLCGTAPSLVEAMSLNLPIISFDVPTNRSTTEGKALYFSSSDELSNIILNVDSNTLFDIKESMGAIARSRYNWNRISQLYKEQILN